MEIEDRIFLDDDADILDIIHFGFPRRIYNRTNWFEEIDDEGSYRRFRLSKPTVLNILEQIEEILEFDNDYNDSLSPINQLLIALRWYACDGHQISIGDFMGCHQSTVSRIVSRVSVALESLRQNCIRMPVAQEIIRKQHDFYSIACFPRVIGCVDGTHVKIQSPGGPDAEIYRNRKSYFSINTQVIGDANLKILDIVARWPGSAHDQTILNNSRICARFENNEFPNCVLLGDGGYTLRSYVITPVLAPITRGEQLLNESQIRTRNTIERLFGVWKRRFPVLAYGLRCSLNTTLSTIIATAVLHNIAVTRNEPPPPPPEHIDIEFLNFLIDQGNIPDVPAVVVPLADQIRNPAFSYRQQLIDHFFSHL